MQDTNQNSQVQTSLLPDSSQNTVQPVNTTPVDNTINSDTSLTEDQRVKKRQLSFIVNRLEILYSDNDSYKVLLRKADEELKSNKGELIFFKEV